MEKPRIKIRRNGVDWLLDSASGVMVILLVALPVYTYSSLPEIIPIHFNARGIADGYGSREMIWIMPILVSLIFVGMAVLANHPHLLNYLVEITKENAERQYRMAARLVRILNFLVAGIFLYIMYVKVVSYPAINSGLGVYFLPFSLMAIFGVLAIYIFMSLKAR